MKMMSNINTMQEALEWLKTPEGQNSLDNYFDNLTKKEAIERTRALRIKEHFNNEAQFDQLMQMVLKKQKRYDARHYKTYSERPLHIVNLLWELVSMEGTLIEHIDDLTEQFPSMIYDYYGYQFAITHGQGSMLSIYKNRECIYRS